MLTRYRPASISPPRSSRACAKEPVHTCQLPACRPPTSPILLQCPVPHLLGPYFHWSLGQCAPASLPADKYFFSWVNWPVTLRINGTGAQGWVLGCTVGGGGLHTARHLLKPSHNACNTGRLARRANTLSWGLTLFPCASDSLHCFLALCTTFTHSHHHPRTHPPPGNRCAYAPSTADGAQVTLRPCNITWQSQIFTLTAAPNGA